MVQISKKIIFFEVMLAKLIPIAIVVPLWLRMQTYFPDFRISFDVEQAAYILAIGIITAASFIEFKIAQGGEKGWTSLNLGSGLAAIISIVGVILIIFVFATQYTNFTGSSQFNDVVTFYLGFSILVIAIQALRDIMGARKVYKGQSLF